MQLPSYSIIVSVLCNVLALSIIQTGFFFTIGADVVRDTIDNLVLSIIDDLTWMSVFIPPEFNKKEKINEENTKQNDNIIVDNLLNQLDVNIYNMSDQSKKELLKHEIENLKKSETSNESKKVHLNNMYDILNTKNIDNDNLKQYVLDTSINLKFIIKTSQSTENLNDELNKLKTKISSYSTNYDIGYNIDKILSDIQNIDDETEVDMFVEKINELYNNKKILIDLFEYIKTNQTNIDDITEYKSRLDYVNTTYLDEIDYDDLDELEIDYIKSIIEIQSCTDISKENLMDYEKSFYKFKSELHKFFKKKVETNDIETYQQNRDRDVYKYLYSQSKSTEASLKLESYESNVNKLKKHINFRSTSVNQVLIGHLNESLINYENNDNDETDKVKIYLTSLETLLSSENIYKIPEITFNKNLAFSNEEMEESRKLAEESQKKLDEQNIHTLYNCLIIIFVIFGLLVMTSSLLIKFSNQMSFDLLFINVLMAFLGFSTEIIFFLFVANGYTHITKIEGLYKLISHVIWKDRRQIRYACRENKNNDQFKTFFSDIENNFINIR